MDRTKLIPRIVLFVLSQTAQFALSPAFTTVRSLVVASINVLMAINAVRFYRSMKQSVGTLKHRLKVFRINTELVVASVMDVVSGWYRSFMDLIGYDMGGLYIPESRSNLSVSGFIKRRDPFPATSLEVYLILLFETFTKWSCFRHNSVLFRKVDGRHLGINVIHPFLLCFPINGQQDNHLSQCFIKREDRAVDIGAGDIVNNRIVQGNAPNRFRDALLSLIVFFVGHSGEKCLRPDRRTDSWETAAARTQANRSECWNGCTMATA